MSFPSPIGDYTSSDDSTFGVHLPRDTNGPETSVNHHTAEDYTAENTPPTTVDSIGAGSQLAPSLITEIDAKATDPAKLAQKEVTKAILPHLRRPLGVLKTSSSSSPIIQTNAEAIASDLAKKEVAKPLVPHLRGRTLVDQPTPSSATMVDTKDLSSAKAVKEKVSNPVPPHLRGLSSVVQTRKESLKNGQNSIKLSEEVLTRTAPPETVATSADESDATQTDTDEPETAATVIDEPGTTATYSNEPETAEADVTEAKTAEIETAPVPGDISREPSPKTSFEQSAQAGSDTSVETAKPVSSIGATGKAILLHIEAIEATEYLSAEAIALLHEVRDDIVARAVDASTAVNFLSAKAFKDPARSVEQHLIKPVSPIKTDAQSRIKPATEESTIRQPVTSSPMVSQSAATSPIPSIGLKKIPASALATSANEQISSQSSSDLTETTSNATAPMSQVSSPADHYLTNIFPAETASAVGAKAVSAKPANGGKANSTAVSTISSGENDENREHKAYFATWGKLQERNTPSECLRLCACSSSGLLTPNSCQGSDSCDHRPTGPYNTFLCR